MSSETPSEVETYVAFLHKLAPDELGSHFGELLDDLPEKQHFLEIFVPEVGLMLTRVLFLRDTNAVSLLVESVETPLKMRQLIGADAPGDLSALSPYAIQRVRYFIGRMVALLVCAKRFLLLDDLGRLRAAHLDGSLSQAVLEFLQESGPKSQRSIQLALKSGPRAGGRFTNQALHTVLRQLVRDELVEQNLGTGRTHTIELTVLGRRLLEEAPPWMEDVEEAYRVYRNLQVGGPSTETRQSLLNLFVRLDREGGRPLPDPPPKPSKRTYPYLDERRLPPPEARRLPRIIP